MNETFSLSMWRNPVNSVVSNLKFDSYNEYVKKGKENTFFKNIFDSQKKCQKKIKISS